MNKSLLIRLPELLVLRESPSPDAIMHLNAAQDADRLHVSFFDPRLVRPTQRGGCWAVANEACGDAPDKYHPKYLAAVLLSTAARVANSTEAANALPLTQWLIPQINFSTEEWTRRSMTLNGMRMSTEYFDTGSMRVLQLIEQRLQAGQRDVAHDVLVYLMNQILDIRAEAQEARSLRAESVAAYLGLNHERVQALFLDTPLSAALVAEQIKAGFAGPLRRSLNVAALLENQVRHLQPALQRCAQKEEAVVHLIDEIAQRLYREPPLPEDGSQN